MKRLIAAAAVSVMASAAAPLPAAATDIDIASTFPTDMLFLGDSLKKFKEAVEAVSGGEITINIHGAGELLPALEVLDGVSTGAIAGGYDWVGYWGGTIPVANLIGSLPFGPAPEVLAEWIWEGGGREIVQKAYDPHNIHFMPCVVVPSEPAGWFRKEINTVEDLQGLRFRIGGLAGRALAKVGVSPQLIPGGEVFVALERGRIDAAEFSLPMVDVTLQLQTAANYYYFPGWHQPASINSIIINKAFWDGLTELEQNQITHACRSAFLWTLTSAVQLQTETLNQLEAGGTQIKRLPPEVLDALRTATDEIIAEERANDPIFDEAYQSLTAHIESRKRWNELQNLE
jgi:TRAP-type mannitol/chloroaromatic compound transport system substrate-binding protein